MNTLNIGISHPIVKEIKQLKRHPVREVAVIEDLTTFGYLMNQHLGLKVFIYCPELVHSPQALTIKEFFSHNSTQIYEVSTKTYLSLIEKENATGFIAIVEQKYVDLRSANPEEYPFIVVLDGLENPGNLGTMIRTCDAAKVDLVVACDPVSKFSNPKTLTSSRGLELVNAKTICNYNEIQDYLIKNNYTIYLGEPDLGKDYQSYDYQGKIAIVIGNERFGINKKWYDQKHAEVFIPMGGKIDCLNVSIAGSILVYEAFMKRR